MYFTDTCCDYRDDNRHLWIYIEESDDEHMFEQEEQKLIELHYAYQHVSQLNAPRLSCA